MCSNDTVYRQPETVDTGTTKIMCCKCGFIIISHTRQKIKRMRDEMLSLIEDYGEITLDSQLIIGGGLNDLPIVGLFFRVPASMR